MRSNNQGVEINENLEQFEEEIKLITVEEYVNLLRMTVNHLQDNIAAILAELTLITASLAKQDIVHCFKIITPEGDRFKYVINKKPNDLGFKNFK
jgi:hypothetical protein